MGGVWYPPNVRTRGPREHGVQRARGVLESQLSCHDELQIAVKRASTTAAFFFVQAPTSTILFWQGLLVRFFFLITWKGHVHCPKNIVLISLLRACSLQLYALPDIPSILRGPLIRASPGVQWEFFFHGRALRLSFEAGWQNLIIQGLLTDLFVKKTSQCWTTQQKVLHKEGPSQQTNIYAVISRCWNTEANLYKYGAYISVVQKYMVNEIYICYCTWIDEGI